MNYIILYPSDYFDIRKVDEDYAYEYQAVVKLPEFNTAFCNYDELIEGKPLITYPAHIEPGLCIYRGWMLQSEIYRVLYETLLAKGITLINTPEEYENAHEFPNSYPLIRKLTPGIKVFPNGVPIDWDLVKQDFRRFMIKDYVKSVKGTDFPDYFDANSSKDELDKFIYRFKEMRGKLFVKGIVVKEYVDLEHYGERTNEYRAFFMNGRLLTLSKNSNQTCNVKVPDTLIASVPQLNSKFYTIDFAELEDGSWRIIEVGDGQVSGLSPNQYVFKFYEEMLNRFIGNVGQN